MINTYNSNDITELNTRRGLLYFVPKVKLFLRSWTLMLGGTMFFTSCSLWATEKTAICTVVQPLCCTKEIVLEDVCLEKDVKLMHVLKSSSVSDSPFKIKEQCVLQRNGVEKSLIDRPIKSDEKLGLSKGMVYEEVLKHLRINYQFKGVIGRVGSWRNPVFDFDFSHEGTSYHFLIYMNRVDDKLYLKEVVNFPELVNNSPFLHFNPNRLNEKSPCD